MKLDEHELNEFRKDVERVRRHEEMQRASAAKEPKPEDPKDEPPSDSVFARLLQSFAALFRSPHSSDESHAAIPEYVVTLLQVIHEQPKFKAWFLASEGGPHEVVIAQLQKLAFAFRIEEGDSRIAEAFDRLQDPVLFRAFSKVLHNET